MHEDPSSTFAIAKIAIAWIGLAVGGLTLSSVALILTIVYTGLQIYKLIREFSRERRLERLQAKLQMPDHEPQVVVIEVQK